MPKFARFAKILLQSKTLDNNFRSERKFFIEFVFATVDDNFKLSAFARPQLQIFKAAIHFVEDKPFAVAIKFSVRLVEGKTDALRFIFRSQQNKFAVLESQFLDDGRFLHRVNKIYRERKIFIGVDDGNRFLFRPDKNFRRARDKK